MIRRSRVLCISRPLLYRLLSHALSVPTQTKCFWISEARRHCRIAPSARRLEPQHASVGFVRADIKVAVRRRPHVANTPV